MNKNSNKRTRFVKTVFLFAFIMIGMLIYCKLTGFHMVCYTRAFTGVPCPGCGMTRAWKSVFHFDFKSAFFYHPMFFLPALIAVLLFFQHRTHKKVPKWVWSILLFLFLLVYGIRMYLYFPTKEPLTFDSYAVLPRMFQWLLHLK